MPSDDPLAQTATAGSANGDAATVPPSIGRYQLIGVLGAGGMGVVHEARDPDLDRNVALKLLRHAATPEARARLLREARAMAKLSHPNVITVYEVGTDGGRDYVAMELIEGTTLADWLASKPRTVDILDAFIAAGRGIVTAHRAGIVHRDFKPQNVLRRGDGRVVVTDFGLAQDVGVVAAPAPDGERSADRTLTGTLIGTPAYMSPEQWRGQAVGPASDQYAFCAAMWEALAGERPFRGATLDELREAVLASKRELDDTRIPRPVRAMLRRGLSIDPAARWPNMDALIARLERVRHRRRRLTVSGTIMVSAAAAAIAVVIAHQTAPTGCAAPSFDPTSIAARATTMGTPMALELLGRWRDRREHACSAPPAERSQRLACLDGVLARLDDALSGSGPLDGDALAVEAVEPEVCDHTPVPHLVDPIDPELAFAFGVARTWSGDVAVDPSTRLRLLSVKTPCARAIALIVKLTENHDALDPRGGSQWTTTADGTSMSISLPLRGGDSAELETAATACGDDAIAADAAVAAVESLDAASVQHVEDTAAAVGSERANATVDVLKAELARSAKRYDDAINLLDHARRVAARSGAVRAEVSAIQQVAEIRLERGRPEDLAVIQQLDTEWRDHAHAPRVARKLARTAAAAAWRSGDVARGDTEAAKAVAGVRSPELPVDERALAALPKVDVGGEVVDEQGVPVPDADVGADYMLMSDGVMLDSPILGTNATTTRTDAKGRFSFHGVRGHVAAQAGDRRSVAVSAMPHVHLVVLPTSRLAGHVTLGDVPPGQVHVVARVKGSVKGQTFLAPIRADGTFVLDRAPRGPIVIGATRADDFMALVFSDASDSRFEAIDVASATVDGIELDARTSSTLTVLARSQTVSAPDTAVVFLFHGHHVLADHKLESIAKQAGAFAAMQVAKPFDVAHVPAGAAPDDLVAQFASRPRGELTVCAIGMSTKLIVAAGLAQTKRAMEVAEANCTFVKPTDTTVVVEVAPVRRPR